MIKLKVTLLTTLLFLNTSSFGQVSLGGKAGPLISSIQSSAQGTSVSILAFSGGVFTDVKLYKFISLQPEILYSMRGEGYGIEYPSPSGGTTITPNISWRCNYIDIPILLKLTLGNRFQMFMNIGASPSFLVSSTYEYHSNPIVKNKGVNSYNLYFIASAGIQGKIGKKIKIFLEPRYYQGTNEVFKNFQSQPNFSIGVYGGFMLDLFSKPSL
jgi:hypothetical protein